MSQQSSSFVKYSKPIKVTEGLKSVEAQKASAAAAINIPGCKPSLHNNQLLTSIGIPSIDYFIGGGLPVGSVCIIGEDTLNYYSDILCRCFIAEGIVNKHTIYLANQLQFTQNLMQRIPNVSSTKESEESEKADIASGLRIAWRYGDKEQQKYLNTSKFEQFHSGKTHNYFLMNKYMSQSEVDSTDVKIYEMNQESVDKPYMKLAEDITNEIDKKFNITKTKEYKSIMRIVINAVGSSLWNDPNVENQANNYPLFRFLLYLRKILRQSLAVCLITVQNDLLNDPGFLSKITNLSDFVFLLDNSPESVSRLAKTQYEGFFKIIKLASLNALNFYMPETLDLAFHVKRKRFVVEIFHLPPEIGEDTDEKKGRTATAALACATPPGQSKLDF